MLLTLPLPTFGFVARLLGRGEGGRPRVTRWFAAQVREGATREIPRHAGRMTVHCRAGQAWITHDGDPKDVVLHANQSHAVDHGARMTLHALKGDCVIEVQVEG